MRKKYAQSLDNDILIYYLDNIDIKLKGYENNIYIYR